jgi:quercetin dioxygenase-like cupin family protein
MSAEAVTSQIIQVADIPWESLTTSVKAKMLWSDPATKRRAQLTRFEPGATLPMHQHVGDELVYVIEGSISDGSNFDESGEKLSPATLVLVIVH